MILKLKHLFDNRDLALMILKNWDYDENRLDLLEYFRISANAVYPFRSHDQVCFLRFSPIEERPIETIEAELDFLVYLRNNGYPACETVPSISGNRLERVMTPWGEYIAVVFKGVPGKQLRKIDLTDEIIRGHGHALGELHGLSRNFTPSQYRRISWQEQIEWLKTELSAFPDEAAAMKETDILYAFLSQLPATPDTFGLIHNDFETDNVFYDEQQDRFFSIDYDDALYHWFVLDIDQALNDLLECLPEEKQNQAQNTFIEGYRSAFPVEDSMLELMPVFRRYADLNGYVRILRSVSELWNNEPDWMTDLRGILNNSAENRKKDFGKPLPLPIQ